MKTNKKIMIQFICILIIAFLIGIGFGLGLIHFYQQLIEIMISLSDVFVFNGIYSYGISFLLLIISTVFYFQSKPYIHHEDEASYEKANQILSKAVTLLNINGPLCFICLGLSGFRLMEWILPFFVLLIFDIVWMVVLQNKVIQAIQVMNPEKKGNILDTKFQKEWFESCDEMEQIKIGQSCYKTFQIMSKIYLVCMIFICAFSMIGLMSPFWILGIGLLWLFQQWIYSHYASKD
ncbi:DUF3169 family protein [Floccifex sp.]|uniref:DUF3169 family protein n=1 Tax=Floccifex sp. TaxID=2815810 RepID=UPI003F082D57